MNVRRWIKPKDEVLAVQPDTVYVTTQVAASMTEEDVRHLTRDYTLRLVWMGGVGENP